MTIGNGSSPVFFNRQNPLGDKPRVSILNLFSGMSIIHTSNTLNVSKGNNAFQYFFIFFIYCL